MQQMAQPSQPAGMPAGANAHAAQMAAALAQAQQELANDPNMTPEMRAQMNAVLAQMQGATGGGIPTDVPAAEGDVIELDGSDGAFLEFESADGEPMTLLVFDRQNGAELLKNEYPDGVIYDYVNFGQFGRPMEQIGVRYSDASGTELAELTPRKP